MGSSPGGGRGLYEPPADGGADRPNLKVIAAARIRERILNGDFRAGQKINQGELAAQLGVSRIPIREALIVLEGEGLVDNIARRGSFVAVVSRDDILDQYTILGSVAGLAAAHAAARIDKAQLDSLAAIVSQMRSETSSGTVGRLCFEFHRKVNSAGAGRRLRSELRRLTESIPTRLFTASPEWRSLADADHLEILHALSVGDAATAAESTRVHLRRGARFAIERLEKRGFWDADADADAVEPTDSAAFDLSLPATGIGR